MTTRITLLLAALTFLAACSDGNRSTTDSAVDSGSDASSDAEIDAAQGDDGDLPDAEGTDGTIADAAVDAPMVDPCLDAGVATADAGTTTLAEACTSYCGTFVPFCSIMLPPGSGSCMSYCETMLANGLSPSKLARAVACQQINSTSQCEAAQTCLALAATCM